MATAPVAMIVCDRNLTCHWSLERAPSEKAWVPSEHGNENPLNKHAMGVGGVMGILVLLSASDVHTGWRYRWVVESGTRILSLRNVVRLPPAFPSDHSLSLNGNLRHSL